MFSILDVATVVEPVTESPIGGYLAMAGTILTPLAGIIAGARYFDEKRRQKNYKAIFADPSTASPAPLPVVDTERVAMMARIAQAERDTAEFRALWKRQDAEQKLTDAVAELNRTRNALTRSRAVVEELKRMNGELRMDNARLQLELDSATPELVEDISARIPTPLRPKPMPKDPL